MYNLYYRKDGGWMTAGGYATLDELANGVSHYTTLHGEKEFHVIPDSDRCVKFADVITRAVKTFGEEMQSIIALEELSELQKEICKRLRGMENQEHLAEEMADVEIMLWQLKYMIQNEEEVEEWIDHKIERLDLKLRSTAGTEDYDGEAAFRIGDVWA